MSILLGILAGRSPSGSLIGPQNHFGYGLYVDANKNFWTHGTATTIYSVPGAGEIAYALKLPSNFTSLLISKGYEDQSGAGNRFTRMTSGSLDPAGGGIVVGGLFNILAASAYQNYVAKIAGDGSITWAKNISNSNSSSNTLTGVSASKVTGSVAVVATSPTAKGLIGFYNSAGVLQWQRDYIYSTYYAGPTGVYVDSTDNVYVVGQLNLVAGGAGQGAFVLKYDSSGTLLWDKVFIDNAGSATSWVRPYGLYVDETNGYIYVNGQSRQAASSTVYYYWISKIDTSGNLVWSRNHLAPATGGATYYQTITVDQDQNVYSAGKHSTSLGFGMQVLVTKCNSGGALQAANLLTFRTPAPASDVQYIGIENNCLAVVDSNLYINAQITNYGVTNSPILKTSTSLPAGKTWNWDALTGNYIKGNVQSSSVSITDTAWAGTFNNASGTSSVSTRIVDVAAAVTVTASITNTTTPTFSQ